jgi:hypothetical protein
MEANLSGVDKWSYFSFHWIHTRRRCNQAIRGRRQGKEVDVVESRDAAALGRIVEWTNEKSDKEERRECVFSISPFSQACFCIMILVGRDTYRFVANTLVNGCNRKREGMEWSTVFHGMATSFKYPCCIET